MPWKNAVEAHVQGVSLIVVDRRESWRNVERACVRDRARADKAPGDRRRRLRDLVGIGEMELAMMEDIAESAAFADHP